MLNSWGHDIDMRNKKTIFCILGLMLVLILSSTTFAISENIVNKDIERLSSNMGSYNGRLRVYITEIVSRWNNNDGNPYHYAFLDFAINEELSIEYQETYTTEATWDAQNVEEDNVMAMAVVFNPESKEQYAYPPTSNKFLAYYVDAVAAAKPSETGYNTVTDGFNHTVFIEEATATWCHNCPATAEALKSVYDKHEYPFYFVALVGDKNDAADDRLQNDFNIYGYPTCFFDGGYKVLVGGVTNENDIERRIEQCGGRDVHELNLSISLEWKNGEIEISVNITNNQESSDNRPPSEPIITGPSSGKKNDEQTFIFKSTDPENQNVYYWIEWGDDSSPKWNGPFDSGAEAQISHTWSERNKFIIEAKTKDSDGIESDWSTFDFSTRASKLRVFESFIIQLRNLPIFQKLLFFK